MSTSKKVRFATPLEAGPSGNGTTSASGEMAGPTTGSSRPIPGSFPPNRPPSPTGSSFFSRQNHFGYGANELRFFQPHDMPSPTDYYPQEDWQLVSHNKPKPTLDARRPKEVKPRRSMDEIKIREKSEDVADREIEFMHQRNLLREEIGSLRKQLSEAEKKFTHERDLLREENGSLRKQLSESKDHLAQAERAANQYRVEMQRLAEPYHSSKFADNDDREAIVISLKEENKDLKKNLDDARSHIFSLQPYIVDMTPERIGTLFDDLMSNVTEWATKLIDQFEENDERTEELLVLVKKKPFEFTKLRKQIEKHVDLCRGHVVPDTDVDIFIAIITRWIEENIFQTVLCGIMPQGYMNVINHVETSMRKLEPKRDLYALRSWRAETLNAVVSSVDYQNRRLPRARQLTEELGSIFKPFRKQKSLDTYHDSIGREIIMPAMALQEAMSTAVHHYYLDLNLFINFNPLPGLEVVEKASQLKLENILQNRKKLAITKLQSTMSTEELMEQLDIVVTLAPALNMRQVGMGNSIRPSTVIRPQHMLVAFGSKEQKEDYRNNGEQTLITKVLDELKSLSRVEIVIADVMRGNIPIG